jgi:hypothetical protein
MSSFFPSDLFSTPRFQLVATALVSGFTVASLIFGYQALEREERLEELKKSIPPPDDEHESRVRYHRVSTAFL